MDGRRNTRADATAHKGWGERQVLRLGAYLAREAWRPAHLCARGPRRLFFRACRVGWLAARGMSRDQCVLRAAALTYITVLSLVPLLALSFSVAKGFGFYADLLHGTINPFLDRTFGPLESGGPLLAPSESSRAVRVALDQVLGFVERTEVSTLGLFGLVLLVWTALKLLSSVELAFNSIWGAERPRSLLRKVSDYLAMVVVTPILLFTATGLTTALQTSAVADFLRESAGLGAAIDFLLRLAPVLAVWAGFTFLYYALPNARTRLASSALGAFVAGLLWQAALLLHIKFQVGVANYSAIYSSFAALPIFLVWINVSWIIVLLGAELCFAHQSEPSYAEAPGARADDLGVSDVVGLRAAIHLTCAFLRGAPPPSSAAIAGELTLPEPSVASALARLAAAGLVVPVEGGGEGWVLARDPGSISAKQVLDALSGGAPRADLPVRSALDELAERVLAGLEGDLESSRHNRTLRQLAEAALRGDPPAGAERRPPVEVRAG